MEVQVDQSFRFGGIFIDSIFENAVVGTAVINEQNEISILADAYNFLFLNMSSLLSNAK